MQISKIYVAVGASETVPVGLHSNFGYPAIVARRCRLKPEVVASVGAAALFERALLLRNAALASVFVGPADVALSEDHDLARIVSNGLRRFDSSRRLIIILAPFSSRNSSIP